MFIIFIVTNSVNHVLSLCVDAATIMKKCDVPGPGSYMPKLGINKNGTYCISNMPNRTTTAWYPTDRFRKPKETREGSPGPGQYH